jgi:hypothetical protein
VTTASGRIWNRSVAAIFVAIALLLVAWVAVAYA